MSSKLRVVILKLVRLALVAAVAALLYNSWRAVVDETGPNRLIVPLQVGEPGEAQLFYDAGSGLREEDSVRIAVEPSASLREIAFPVPRVPLRTVRFDPLPGAGKFKIGQPRLVSAAGRVIAKFPLAAIVPRNEIGEFRREGDEWTGATVAGATDPQLTLTLASPLRVGRVRLPWIEAGLVVVLAWLAGWLAGRPGADGSAGTMP